MSLMQSQTVGEYHDIYLSSFVSHLLLAELGYRRVKHSLHSRSKEYAVPAKMLEGSVQPVFTQGKGEMGKNLDQGQKHPLFPADNPAWEWDAQSFVPDFGWYGEHSWTDVRMRVVGHMAMAYRDLVGSHPPKQLGCWDSNISRNDSDIEIYRHHYFTICR